MKRIFSFMFLAVCSIIMLNISDTVAQTPRTVISSGAGWYSTVGQPTVGFSKSTPNSMWQGFWVPKNIVSSVIITRLYHSQRYFQIRQLQT
jgi:hypothetical protein